MLLVRIRDGQIGFLVGVFSQPILRQTPATMVHGELVQPPPQPGTLISGCVAVGDHFVLCPIGEITPIYEMPEEEENAENGLPDASRASEEGTAVDPAATAGDPPRETEGEDRSQA